MITEEQYHEAMEVELLQENLPLWEERFEDITADDLEYLDLKTLIVNTKRLLKILTGNERGFLRDNAPQGE
jgi:hypothetical protein